MGVNSLWEIVGPAARPVKLEALSRKKLAVDASIWIYQFLKAVRDKDGNSLGQSHIVGFFRRICKLLYHGILPLFVFDGGAPALKRRVIQQRKERRQENQEDATMTAQKLLARQLQHGKNLPQTPKPKRLTKALATKRSEGTVYLEDMPILHPEHGVPQDVSPQKIESNESSPIRKFMKKDEYHLPDIKQFTIAKDDNRIMPANEFQEYAENADFDTVDGVSIDSVDPSSKQFADLPLATQYMILSHLRLRSRLRLGYTKDQLEGLFPNSKDFSRFQIEQVKKRNYYTQQLMTVSGMLEDGGNVSRRVAGDKDRHYTLMKNDDGWTLSLGDSEGELVELDENGEVSRSLLSSLGDDFKSKNEDAFKIENKEIEDSSESEDFQDVEVQPDNEDHETNEAVIQSIYHMYKDDYDEEVVSKDNEQDLRRAVESSKRKYMEQQKEEHDLKKTIENMDLEKSDQLNFDHSVLFGNQESLKDEKAPELDDDDLNSIEEAAPPQQVQTTHQPMPSWFDESVSQVERPHSGDRFYSQRLEYSRQANDDDNVGLISYSEARDLIEERKRSVSDHESDAEILEERGTDQKAEVIEIDDLRSDSGKKNDSEENLKLQNTESQTDDNIVVDEKPFLNDVEKHEDEPKAGPELMSQPSSSSREKIGIVDYEIEESEEEELVRQLREEDHQYEQFASEMKTKHQIPISSTSRITDDQLYQERVQKAKRDSDEVTQTMIQDVQELLKRFGIPFITAPMEAEAQCAELFLLKMVDGIITDDSDCFLFGGSRIYKNMFNQKQYVECYFSEEIDHKIGLDRHKLIELALLLGSDYTEGIKSIGPVLAMEILAEFGSLKRFKSWFDEHARGVVLSNSSPSKLEKNLLNRIKSGKLFLPDNFPDQIVFQAYTHPEVDRDKSEFKWGVPNLDQIRSFLMYNVGWTQSQVDEVMLPLIRDMNRKRAEGTQSTVGDFFPQEYVSYKKDVAFGKRMKVAAKRLHEKRAEDS